MGLWLRSRPDAVASVVEKSGDGTVPRTICERGQRMPSDGQSFTASNAPFPGRVSGSGGSQFAGLECVVTGGTGALGTAVVARLLAGGARVHVPWIEKAELERFPLRAHVALSQVDLQDEAQVEEYYRSLPDVWASIHVAGGFAMAPVVETSGHEFERMFRLNALTAFFCCREAVRTIRAADQKRSSGIGGRIVNVAARPAVRPVGGMIAYSVSKSSVAALTESLAEEVKADGILVNAVLPSIMDTPANRGAMPSADHRAWPKASEVAEAIAFLASRENALTSGALVPVFGRA
jgi:NAD(P)-dependent dehydrogenase (short-subunit alcohol dehydrogenase family)